MIYLLTRKDDVDFDEFTGKVVRAENEAEARHIANQRIGDEGRIWCDPDVVVCEVIDPNGQSQPLLEAFNAG